MTHHHRIGRLALCGLLVASAAASQAQIAITEWMYNGSEFVEFTNLGASAVDMTGWSYDDESRIPGEVSLSAFGSVAAGESVILSEASAGDFRVLWGLAATVKVIGNNSVNLGRNDEINLFDAQGGLVDRLRYGDSSYVPGTIRTLNISGNPTTLALLTNDTSAGWVLSTPGDAFGSLAVNGGLVGNPGVFALAVPEPAAVALMLAGLLTVTAAARRRRP